MHLTIANVKISGVSCKSNKIMHHLHSKNLEYKNVCPSQYNQGRTVISICICYLLLYISTYQLGCLALKWRKCLWYILLLMPKSEEDHHHDLTSSSRTRKVTLLPMLAVNLLLRVDRTKPRGGRYGHCCFRAVYNSFTPFVQLFATTLRYLKHTTKSKTSLKWVSLLR